MVTADHKLLFLTDEELIELLRAIEAEQDRRDADERGNYATKAEANSNRV